MGQFWVALGDNGTGSQEKWSQMGSNPCSATFRSLSAHRVLKPLQIVFVIYFSPAAFLVVFLIFGADEVICRSLRLVIGPRQSTGPEFRFVKPNDQLTQVIVVARPE